MVDEEDRVEDADDEDNQVDYDDDGEDDDYHVKDDVVAGRRAICLNTTTSLVSEIREERTLGGRLLNYHHIDDHNFDNHDFEDDHFDNHHIEDDHQVRMIIVLFRLPQNLHLALGQTTSDLGLSHHNTIIITIIIIIIIMITIIIIIINIATTIITYITANIIKIIPGLVSSRCHCRKGKRLRIVSSLHFLTLAGQ